MRTVKADIDGDVRRTRVAFPATASSAQKFQAIRESVLGSFGLSESGPLLYRDEEGDLCTLVPVSVEDMLYLSNGGTLHLFTSKIQLASSAEVLAQDAMESEASGLPHDNDDAIPDGASAAQSECQQAQYCPDVFPQPEDSVEIAASTSSNGHEDAVVEDESAPHTGLLGRDMEDVREGYRAWTCRWQQMHQKHLADLETYRDAGPGPGSTALNSTWVEEEEVNAALGDDCSDSTESDCEVLAPDCEAASSSAQSVDATRLDHIQVFISRYFSAARDGVTRLQHMDYQYPVRHQSTDPIPE